MSIATVPASPLIWRSHPFRPKQCAHSGFPSLFFTPSDHLAEPKHEYQNIRKKAFPWGQQAIFFNPKANYPSEEM